MGRMRRHSCDCPECGVDQRAWVAAFAAYRAALAKPYTHVTLPAREAEVSACFDQLVRLQEGR